MDESLTLGNSKGVARKAFSVAWDADFEMAGCGIKSWMSFSETRFRRVRYS